MKNRQLKIFFSGMAGSGVSAIAGFMSSKGHIVAGSDRVFDKNPDHPLKKTFMSAGIAIVPQDGHALDNSFDLAVFSTAVEAGMPEVSKARALEIPVRTRPACLCEIAESFRTTAVSGTSGKSTASGLLAFLMRGLGLSPNFIGGGRVKQFRTSSNPGNFLAGESDYLVIEACESDGSIVNYRPRHSILLNLALDHHPVDKTAAMFRALMENTSEKTIVNADDKNLSEIRGKDSVTFSIRNPSHYRPGNIEYRQFSTDFSLHGTSFSLALPGEHNLYNALSCIALLAETGIPLDDIARLLPRFQGIERRFDIHLNDGERLVIDDYAHNPHKISSLMKTAGRFRESVCYIFQPHGFAPTRMMKDEYIEAFRENLRDRDHLVILPVYYAGGTAAGDISSHDLAAGIKAGGKSAEVMEKRDDVFKLPDKYRTLVIFGARDETLADLAKQIAGIRSQISV